MSDQINIKNDYNNPSSYEAFIYKKLTEGSINDSQLNYLLSAQGNEEIMTVLESMDLRHEYKSYCNQQMKNSQDDQYQDSIIEDRIRKNIQQINQYQDYITSLREKVNPLKEEYNNWEARIQKFPENPRFQSRRNSLHEAISNINTEIGLLEQEIIQIEEDNNTLQIARSIT